jgi:hypothetical protein
MLIYLASQVTRQIFQNILYYSLIIYITGTMSTSTVTETTQAAPEKLTLAFDNSVHQGVNSEPCLCLLQSIEKNTVQILRLPACL